MIASNAELEEKRDDIILGSGSTLEGVSDGYQTTYTYQDVNRAMQEYAKWYGEKVVDRCAEKAKFNEICLLNNTHNISNTSSFTDYEGDYWEYSINKESILKVKEEL